MSVCDVVAMVDLDMVAMLDVDTVQMACDEVTTTQQPGALSRAPRISIRQRQEDEELVLCLT